jgi:serine/threonine protein kinase HipA of HipAB toxin-antitoxin module
VGTIERIARPVRPLSTDPDADLILILKRALFAWLIADGDMHLKNLALLKVAEAGSNHFGSVHIAPLYDAVTTRVFPRLARDRMALKLNGKDDRLRRADFKALLPLPASRPTTPMPPSTNLSADSRALSSSSRCRRSLLLTLKPGRRQRK